MKILTSLDMNLQISEQLFMKITNRKANKQSLYKIQIMVEKNKSLWTSKDHEEE